jgi:hypothetical protein
VLACIIDALRVARTPEALLSSLSSSSSSSSSPSSMSSSSSSSSSTSSSSSKFHSTLLRACDDAALIAVALCRRLLRQHSSVLKKLISADDMRVCSSGTLCVAAIARCGGRVAGELLRSVDFSADGFETAAKRAGELYTLAAANANAAAAGDSGGSGDRLNSKDKGNEKEMRKGADKQTRRRLKKENSWDAATIRRQ